MDEEEKSFEDIWGVFFRGTYSLQDLLEDFSSPDDDDFEENTLSSHEKWQEVRSRKNKKTLNKV